MNIVNDVPADAFPHDTITLYAAPGDRLVVGIYRHGHCVARITLSPDAACRLPPAIIALIPVASTIHPS